jgi:FO synthase
MNESISRAAGTTHGQETSPQLMIDMIQYSKRIPRQRNTLYGEVSAERIQAGLDAAEITDVVNTPAARYERKRRGPLLRPGLIEAVDVR